MLAAAMMLWRNEICGMAQERAALVARGKGER